MKKITKLLQNLVTCTISIVIALASFTAKIFNYFPKINQNVLLGLGSVSFIVGILSFAFFLIKFIKKDKKSVSEDKPEKKEKLNFKKPAVLKTPLGDGTYEWYYFEKGEKIICDKDGKKNKKQEQAVGGPGNETEVKTEKPLALTITADTTTVPTGQDRLKEKKVKVITFWSVTTDEERNKIEEQAVSAKFVSAMSDEEKIEFRERWKKMTWPEREAFRYYTTLEFKDDYRIVAVKMHDKRVNEKEKEAEAKALQESKKINEENLTEANKQAEEVKKAEDEKANKTLAERNAETTQTGTQTYIVRAAVKEALQQAGIDTKGKVRSSSGWKWIAAAVAAILIFAIVGIGVWIYWLNIKSSHDAKLAKQTSVDSGTKSQNVTVVVNTDPKQIDSILKANAPLLAKYIADSLCRDDSVKNVSNVKDSSTFAQVNPLIDSVNKQIVQVPVPEEHKSKTAKTKLQKGKSFQQYVIVKTRPIVKGRPKYNSGSSSGTPIMLNVVSKEK